MKRLISIIAIALAASIWIAVSACNTAIINTPTRVFDRPSDVALTCLLWNTSVTPNTYEVHPVGDCNPNVSAAEAHTDMGLEVTPTLGPNPNSTFLVTLVAQSARGEVAFADTVQNKLIDIDPLKPSFGFLPVGTLPEHIRTSSDGCFGYTANSGSCDFGRIDINAVIDHSQRQEVTGNHGKADLAFDDLAVGAERIRAFVQQPDGSRKYLAARPSWIEMAPDFDGTPAIHGYEQGGTPGQCIGGTHKAWVAFPNCQLVAKIDLEPQDGTNPAATDYWSHAGQIEQAIQVTRTGATVITDLTTIPCAAECAVDVPPGSDLALPPPVIVDAGADAGTTVPLPTTQAAPTTLAVDTGDSPNTGGRLVIGDAYGERVDIIPLIAPPLPATSPPTPAGLGTPRKVQLEAGALGVTVVRVSPRSLAGKFLYAIARDATVRVVDLDRELECETNPSPRFSGGGIDLQLRPAADPTQGLAPDPVPQARRLGCFPLHDPSDPVQPPRSSQARSPGITLAPGQLPTDIAFVHVSLPPGNVDTSIVPPPAAPGLLVGDFAWIVTSDGRASVVQIFDDCPQPNQQDLNVTTGPYPHGSCDLANVALSRTQTREQLGHPEPLLLDRLSHRIRGGHPRYVAPLTFSDTAGMARIADETEPFGVSVPATSQGDGGIADAGIAAGLPAFYAENVPEYLTQQGPNGVAVSAADITLTRIVRFIDPDLARNESWVAAWEGTIPGSDRTLGHPFVDTDGVGKLTDSGGAWCSRGVLAGDKLVIKGCLADIDCNQAQVKNLGDMGFGHTGTGQGPTGGVNGYNNFKCVTDPGAPADVFAGLCLVEDTQHNDNYWSSVCGPLLRSQRKYRIVHARQNATLTNGEGVTDVLEVAEIYEPEYPEQTQTCAVDTDCANITVSAADGQSVLATRCLGDADGTNRCLVPCSTDDTRCGADFECQTSQLGDQRCMRGPIDKQMWATCFPELLEYQILVGDSFLIAGTVTPFVNDETTDANGECVVPTVPASSSMSEYIRLHNARIPLTPANVCPASQQPLDSIDTALLPATNVCSINTITGSRVLHYENAAFNVALQVPTQGASTLPIVPPDGTTVTMSFVGGGVNLTAPLGVDVQAQQPTYAVVAPDGQTVYIVDEGSSSQATGLRGQLLRLFSPTQAVDTLFIVR